MVGNKSLTSIWVGRKCLPHHIWVGRKSKENASGRKSFTVIWVDIKVYSEKYFNCRMGGKKSFTACGKKGFSTVHLQ
jgi:hypothetical protein